MKYVFGIACLLLAGCAALSDRPTVTMVEEEMRRVKKLVPFVSELSPLEIVERTLRSGCGSGVEEYSSTVPAGPGAFVNASSSYRYSVDHGQWLDGAMWIALRVDGPFHGVSSGATLVPRIDGGSDVVVFAADIRQTAFIKAKLETGTLFCHWRDFDYPYD